jgi:hypothetical protein
LAAEGRYNRLVVQRLQPFIVRLLLCLQAALGALQGQTVFLERRIGPAVCATAGFDEIEDFCRGPHRHDEIPLHVHVPDDDVPRTRSLAVVEIPRHELAWSARPCLLIDRFLSVKEQRLRAPGGALEWRADSRVATMRSLRAVRMLV